MNQNYPYDTTKFSRNHSAEQKRLVAKIQNPQKGGGGGVLFVTNRNGISCVVVIHERAGNYAGKWNFPCGKHEISGNLDLTLCNEAYEEFGFHVGLPKLSCRKTLQNTALIQMGKGVGTVVACVELTQEISRATVNAQMRANINDPLLDVCYKEIDKVELVPIQNILACPVDGNSHTVNNLTDNKGVTRSVELTSFVISVVHEFHKIETF